MIVDLGTGDGRAALALAEAQPENLVIAVDANAASMAETSRRAARSPGRGGWANLLFVVAAAEDPPAELTGIADEVRILFPWGSLLRGVLGADERVAAGVASLVRPGGLVSAIVSVTARDGLDGLPSLDAAGSRAVDEAIRPSGLRLVDIRRVGGQEVRETRSTWGRRLLGGPAERPVWSLLFVTEPSATESDGRPEAEAAV